MRLQSYVVRRIMLVNPDAIWSVLKDLRNFAVGDYYHSGFEWRSDRRGGVGASFIVRHTYFPAYFFPPDMVMCVVAGWQTSQFLHVKEINSADRRKNHDQKFSLRQLDAPVSATEVVYEISYQRPDSFLASFVEKWVSFWAYRRMSEKLEWFEEKCKGVK